MGYTQYWTIEKPLDKAFIEFSEDAKRIIETAIEAGIPLGDGFGNGIPFVSPSEITFNGVGDDSHETFSINSSETGFNFCKTNGKPYDAVVTAILIRAKFYFEGAIRIKSDGDWTDWEGGQLLYETVFDLQPESVLLGANA